MGGSGGGYFRNVSPQEVHARRREEEERTQRQEFDAKVSRELDGLLAAFNNRDVEAVQTHIDTIVAAISAEIDGTVTPRLGGSVAKHTYVDGLSDIDCLVVLNDSDLANKTPDSVLRYFKKRLEARLPNTEISVGDLAVTVKFSDGEIQILPALRSGDRMKIPTGARNSWRTIAPKEFTDALTAVNKDNGGKVIPTIKLAKGLTANLPKGHRISGYHLECLALEAFRNYKGPENTKAMLQHLVSEIPKALKTPIPDVTGQSSAADNYLGAAGSAERKAVASAYNRLARKLRNAEGARSVEQWMRLFDD